MIDTLAEKIISDKVKFNGIYGVPRGGLPIAVSLSHRLNLQFYMLPSNEILVVDDISDTGKTLKDTLHKRIACLYTTSWTEQEPDYYAKIKDKQ